ncbi:MFS transporter [Rubellicoccus peritrichatus]|uniref:MFS transporter n=1 Tax=Rubellicoccus peritrichatus TaxID=3080537 RepID=A0AAQ3L963_9BACT|nr:MFS transporter [Puniceicoccus sp. CR14]WOO39595.1 MFS transporter [Puniceicoccus sp. CR14]
MTGPLRLPNIRLFIFFRVLFNARFYYPIFTVLFLDMGLTLEQFFLLNAVWAVSIVLLEVPSGAFADTFGRRNLVVLAGCCMVVEMLILCFVPIGNNIIIFWALLINRVISGGAEAFASGADEALAFDTLKQEGEEDQWPKVLDLQMRCQSAAFVVAMLLGAGVYDADFMTMVAGLVGFEGEIHKATSLRFPLYLNLITALAVLFIALKMREAKASDGDDGPKSASAAFKLVFQTGRWILKTPTVLIIIAAALTFDSTARTIITLASEYYRLIQIPDVAFGVLGALFGAIGIIAPIYARKLVERKSPLFNWSLVAVILLVSLCGMAFAVPYWGVIPVMGIGLTMMLLGFFVSHYLNQSVEDSNRRATVLSFRSLATNLAYGTVGLLYMGITAALRKAEDKPDESEIGKVNTVFADIIAWTPLYYILTVIALIIVAKFVLRKVTS